MVMVQIVLLHFEYVFARRRNLWSTLQQSLRCARTRGTLPYSNGATDTTCYVCVTSIGVLVRRVGFYFGRPMEPGLVF